MRIENGRMWANKENPEWCLLEGEGVRTYDKHIDFSESFSEPPKVVLGITYTDFINDSAHRIQAYTKDITVHGFSIEIKTWGDTHIWGAGVNWLAYGT